MLAAITDRKAGFRSLSNAWADTTTSHGRPMLTVLGGPGGVRAQRGPRACQGSGREVSGRAADRTGVAKIRRGPKQR
jgi:hypothetical protein